MEACIDISWSKRYLMRLKMDDHNSAIKALHIGDHTTVKNVYDSCIKKKNKHDVIYASLIYMDSLLAQGKRKEVKAILESIIMEPELINSQAFRTKIFRVMMYMCTKLTPKTVDIIPMTSIGMFRMMNTSSVYNDNTKKICMIVRAINYEKKNRSFGMISGSQDKVFLSKNYYMEMDTMYRLISYHEISDKSNTPRYMSSPFHGYEDARLVRYRDRWMFTATYSQLKPYFLPSMVLCTLNDDLDISSVVPLKCQEPRDVQKNWLPFVDQKGRLLVVYKMSPFIINEIDSDTGDYKEIVNISMPSINFPFVRGSSSPIPFNKGYLFIVHMVNGDVEGEEIYWSKMVWMNEALVPKKISGTFYLTHKGNEFVSGMITIQDDVYMSFSIKDAEAKLAKITWTSIRSLLPWYNINNLSIKVEAP